MVTIEYQLIDSFENYKDFDSARQAAEWVRGIGEEYFQYVSVTLGDHYVSGFLDVITALGAEL